MKITYINHSCFLIELKDKLILFDYYSKGLDGDGPLPGLPPLPSKKLYVLVSHKHVDHFDRKIFALERQHADICYILSKDTKMNKAYMQRNQIPESVWDKIQYVTKNMQYVIAPDFNLTTLESTDKGVAFLLQTEGKTIYHAGDLNWWTWKGETEAEARDMEQRFKREMKKLEGIPVDVAFLPLDPRQEERFYWGFDYFMKHTKTQLAYPMHFWGDKTVVEKLKKLELSKDYRNRIAE